MKENVKQAIEAYQCTGCSYGYSVESCYRRHSNGIGCGEHIAGTYITKIGRIFLGMPRGFNRLGENSDLKPFIYETYDTCDWRYDMFNVPIWKYLSKEGHTFVRVIVPRLNITYIHVFLENCIDKIKCIEITETDIYNMD